MTPIRSAGHLTGSSAATATAPLGSTICFSRGPAEAHRRRRSASSVHGHDVGDVVADDAERPLRERGERARRRSMSAAAAAGARRCAATGRRRRRAPARRPRPGCRGVAGDGERRARQQPAATDRRDDHVEVGHVLQQLECRGALAGDDPRVVVRMDLGGTRVGAGPSASVTSRAVRIVSQLDDGGAVRLAPPPASPRTRRGASRPRPGCPASGRRAPAPARGCPTSGRRRPRAAWRRRATARRSSRRGT